MQVSSLAEYDIATGHKSSEAAEPSSSRTSQDDSNTEYALSDGGKGVKKNPSVEYLPVDGMQQTQAAEYALVDGRNAAQKPHGVDYALADGRKNNMNRQDSSSDTSVSIDRGNGDRVGEAPLKPKSSVQAIGR